MLSTLPARRNSSNVKILKDKILIPNVFETTFFSVLKYLSDYNELISKHVIY